MFKQVATYRQRKYSISYFTQIHKAIILSTSILINNILISD